MTKGQHATNNSSVEHSDQVPYTRAGQEEGAGTYQTTLTRLDALDTQTCESSFSRSPCGEDAQARSPSHEYTASCNSSDAPCQSEHYSCGRSTPLHQHAPTPSAPAAPALYNQNHTHSHISEVPPCNHYYYYGYYPHDRPVPYAASYPSMNPTGPHTPSLEGDSGHKDENSRMSSDTGVAPAILAPMPMGVCYSMPVYQRPVCYAEPSNVPMVGYHYPGPVQAPMAAMHAHDEHEGMPPNVYAYDGHSPRDSVFVHAGPPQQPMYAGVPPSSGAESYGSYMPTGGAPYYGYSLAPPPMAAQNMIPSPIPVAYGMSAYDRQRLNVTSDTTQPRGRRRNGAQNRRLSSTWQSRSTARAPATGKSDGATAGSRDVSPPVPLPSASVAPSPLSDDTDKAPLSLPESQQQGLRSNFVLWCGNVPADATLEELWSFFEALPCEGTAGNRDENTEPSSATSRPDNNEVATETPVATNQAGILSIFIISRSSCAFVNYDSQEALDRACAYFHGRPLRPKANCPRLVCRPRKIEDAEYAGVAAQRGKCVHLNWYKQQMQTLRQDPTSLDQNAQDGGQEDTLSLLSERSFTSTNSSLLRQPLFKERFFILKSRTLEALEMARDSGFWATQPHNEPVLDQAFRNSEVVTLFFSENFSGQFFGYAVMRSQSGDGPEGHEAPAVLHPMPVPDGGMDSEPKTTNSASDDSAASSVSTTPSLMAERRAHSDLAAEAKMRNLQLDTSEVVSDSEETDADPPMVVPTPGTPTGSASTMEAANQSSLPLSQDTRSLQMGRPFQLEWKVTSPLPFSEIQSLRNPWRDNRLIKVSRDGTELEPNVGRKLLKIWEAYATRTHT